MAAGPIAAKTRRLIKAPLPEIRPLWLKDGPGGHSGEADHIAI
jgi:hypothetical protein